MQQARLGLYIPSQGGCTLALLTVGQNHVYLDKECTLLTSRQDFLISDKDCGRLTVRQDHTHHDKRCTRLTLDSDECSPHARQCHHHRRSTLFEYTRNSSRSRNDAATGHGCTGAQQWRMRMLNSKVSDALPPSSDKAPPVM